MKRALLSAKPTRKRGPWHVLCDNERFLKAKITLQGT
jgi:hypothetical protein